MNKIRAEYNGYSHQPIIDDILAGKLVPEMVNSHKLTAETIRKIKRHVSQFKEFEIHMTDGVQRIYVAHVTTRHDFTRACRHVLKVYRGTFSRLELPQWRLSSGGKSVKIIDIQD